MDAKRCLYCELPIEGYKHGNKKYHPECSDAIERKRNAERMARSRAGRAETLAAKVKEKKCAYCGEPFTAVGLQVSAKKYCDECVDEARRQQQRENYRRAAPNKNGKNVITVVGAWKQDDDCREDAAKMGSFFAATINPTIKACDMDGLIVMRAGELFHIIGGQMIKVVSA